MMDTRVREIWSLLYHEFVSYSPTNVYDILKIISNCYIVDIFGIYY